VVECRLLAGTTVGGHMVAAVAAGVVWVYLV